MKIGQMASYLDQGLPEPVREALAELQADAPPMAAELVGRGHPCRARRRARSEVFAEWETTPLASASIGQVHRAVTHDGRAVAVKVQYPGVEEAMRADLDNSDLLFGVLSMMFPGMDPKPIVGEIRDRLVEELDYVHEADEPAALRRPLPRSPVHPRPRRGRRAVDRDGCSRPSSRRAPGSPRCSTWSQDERNLAAECLFRFAFGGIYRLHAFNGDPHPGQLPVPPGRPCHVPRLRPVQALHPRRGLDARGDDPGVRDPPRPRRLPRDPGPTSASSPRSDG